MNTTSDIFGIPLFPRKKQEIRQEIQRFLSGKSDEFFHITSLNPELLVIARHDLQFGMILRDSSLKIVDGVGVVVAGTLLKKSVGERYAGVDVMKDILDMAGRGRLRTVLIGGKSKLAERIADCYNDKFGQKLFFGIETPQNMSASDRAQSSAIISQVNALKPRIVFVAFGSPLQEKWIYENRASLSGKVCMGVGGAFDFIGGEVKRAPALVRSAGFEWLYRLLIQPWRLKRQLRLIEFATMVLAERFTRHVQ